MLASTQEHLVLSSLPLSHTSNISLIALHHGPVSFSECTSPALHSPLPPRSADSALLPADLKTTADFYAHLTAQLQALVDGQRSWVPNLSNASSLIYHSINAWKKRQGKTINWAGELALRSCARDEAPAGDVGQLCSCLSESCEQQIRHRSWKRLASRTALPWTSLRRTQDCAAVLPPASDTSELVSHLARLASRPVRLLAQLWCFSKLPTLCFALQIHDEAQIQPSQPS